MKNRRTIRSYSDKEVSDDMLSQLLEVAARSSNTGNMQLYSVVVTRDSENKARLAPAHFNQPMVTKAPVVLTFCADYNRFVKWCEASDAEPGYDNFQSFVASMIDTTIFAQAFCDAAESQGLGICYLGTTTYNAATIIRELNLPKRVVPVTTITLGFPESIPAQVERLDVEAIMHNESYKDYSADDIKRLYNDKESLEVNKSYVEQNGKQTLAQVFTDIRYTKKNNEFFSAAFLEVLKEQGFM